MSRRINSTLILAATLLLSALALEFACRSGAIPQYLFPRPTEIGAALFAYRADLAAALWETARCAVIGLGISIVVGSGVALLLSLSATMRLSFLPFLVLLQTVPIVAIAPVLIIWFGFGAPTVIASASIVSLFPVIANVMLGISSTDPAQLELFQVLRASRWQTIRRLKIPSALPYFLAGLRISVGLAVIGAIVGEFIAGGGLGAIVDSARTQQRLDLLFAAVLLASVLGWALVGLASLAERQLIGKWHASHR